MEDIGAIFEDILSSEEKREQLKSIASMLGIDENAQFDMSSISGLFGGNSESSDSGQQKEAQKESQKDSTADFDIGKLLKLKDAFSSEKNDKNIELLTALKPHLNEKHQAKIDQSIKLMKLLALVPILKDFGIFGGDIL